MIKFISNLTVHAALALSSPSGAAKEDNIVHGRRILMKCGTWKHEMTDGNTDGTSDIGDYVDCILDHNIFYSFSQIMDFLLKLKNFK